jgi:hypothetical protein
LPTTDNVVSVTLSTEVTDVGEFGSSAFRPSVPLFSTSNQQPTTFGYSAAVFSGVDMLENYCR